MFGIDLKKFTVKELTLDTTKSFDENLQANFGISADQAAEIVNYALINDIPLDQSKPAELPPTPMSGGVLPAVALAGPALSTGVAMTMSGIMAAVQLARSAGEVASHVAAGIAYMDKASNSLVDQSKLKESANLWREQMNRHCPKIHLAPAGCSTFDLECKLLNFDDRGKALAQYEVDDAICTMATGKYKEAFAQVPAAEQRMLKNVGEGVGGVMNVAFLATTKREDLDKLVKDKIVTKDGVVLDAAAYDAFIIQRLNPAPATSAPPGGVRRKNARTYRRKNSRARKSRRTPLFRY